MRAWIAASKGPFLLWNVCGLARPLKPGKTPRFLQQDPLLIGGKVVKSDRRAAGTPPCPRTPKSDSVWFVMPGGVVHNMQTATWIKTNCAR
ncbi:uncharacterized protein B0I36DRAFT_320951 [Microdochium trichocladiopsis]|uniref:Uncharacterized protein n=1 Tax=Microdochium trichocladiopsis TaxID=1682393 RepID=A0A9P8Y9S2_9PEZI|nr:uncharacterized protein B0I36DRAFT_320951 [Microdochium trichocladiopsis]KAH7033196.1 hypothetical protein B0I36DRAFT_320951 [Microdochium trichocladiopsis]